MQWASCQMTEATDTTFATVCAIPLPHRLLTKSVLPVWSNFEIADMEFWRSDAYSAYFDHLDSKGGFYYEV
jgi:hypothetical protein